MKRAFLISIIAYLTTALIPVRLPAQGYVQTPVEISQEKVKIDGQIFFVHKVMSKQTLYSISKAYQVSLDEIYKYNADAANGLKEGSFLYIPLHGKAVTPQQQKKEDTKTETVLPEQKKIRTVSDLSKKELWKLKRHRIKWYETIDDIAEKYEVDKALLLQFNEMTGTASDNKKYIYIPNEKKVPIRLDQEEAATGNQEDVKPDEKSLFKDNSKDAYGNITSETELKTFDTSVYRSKGRRSYKISVILPLNVYNRADASISNNMDIYSGIMTAIYDLSSIYDLSRYTFNIIDQEQFSSTSEIVRSGLLDDSELIIGPILIKDIAPVAEFAKENRIPVVSPLDTRSDRYLEGNPYFFLYPVLNEVVDNTLISSFMDETHFGNGKEYRCLNPSSISTSEYAAFLNKYYIEGKTRYSGLNINNVVSSLEKTPVIDQNTLKHLNNAVPEGGYVKYGKYRISTKELALQNRLHKEGFRTLSDMFWYDMNARGYDVDRRNGRFKSIDMTSFGRKAGNISRSNKNGLKNLLIYNKEERKHPAVDKIIRELNERNANFDTLSYNILNGREISKFMFYKLDTLGHNKVLIASEDQAFIADAMRNLDMLKSVKKLSIDVYGLTKWRQYETLELKNMHSLNTHLVLSADVFYADSLTHGFIEKYREIFRAEPSAYAFRGYDIATFFISALCEYGREFPIFISGRECSLLQSNVKFIRVNEHSGFMNAATRNVLFAPGWEVRSWKN